MDLFCSPKTYKTRYNYCLNSFPPFPNSTPSSLAGKITNYYPTNCCSTSFNNTFPNIIANTIFSPSLPTPTYSTKLASFEMSYSQMSSNNKRAVSELAVEKPDCEAVSSTKSSRPFTAYPFPCPPVPPPSKNYSSIEAYKQFREKVLSEFRAVPVKRKGTTGDDALRNLKRRKNNAAARKSREVKKAMEDDMVIKCGFIERENAQMRTKVVELEMEAKMLQLQLDLKDKY